MRAARGPLGAPDRKGEMSTDTPIFVAVRANDIALAENALTSNPDSINSFDTTNSYTPLQLATLRGNFTMVEFLLSRPNIDPNIRNSQGQDALELSLLIGHPLVKELLFRQRAVAQGLLPATDFTPKPPF